jgi:hypothetical protein
MESHHLYIARRADMTPKGRPLTTAFAKLDAMAIRYGALLT